MDILITRKSSTRSLAMCDIGGSLERLLFQKSALGKQSFNFSNRWHTRSSRRAPSFNRFLYLSFLYGLNKVSKINVSTLTLTVGCSPRREDASREGELWNTKNTFLRWNNLKFQTTQKGLVRTNQLETYIFSLLAERTKSVLFFFHFLLFTKIFIFSISQWIIEWPQLWKY